MNLSFYFLYGIVFATIPKKTEMKKFLILLVFASVSVPLFSQYSRSEILQNLEKSAHPQDQVLTATLKQASRLFGEKDDLTSVIAVLPAGTRVTVTGSDSDYYKVLWEDTEGFIFKQHAELATVSAATQVEREQQVNEEPVQKEEQAREMSRFEYLQKKYGPRIAAQINAGKIWKGMTAQMVQDSWGNPRKINRSISGNFVKEEWIYVNTWLYIENNTLIDWGPIRK